MAKFLIDIIDKGLLIPDDPTNGDIFNSFIDVDNGCVDIHEENNTITFTFAKDWWNSLYQIDAN